MTSASRRASSVGLGLLWLLAPPFPDGSLDQEDRPHAVAQYSGIVAEPPAFVDVFIDDISFSWIEQGMGPMAPPSPKPGVTVSLVTSTGSDLGHVRLMRYQTLLDLERALEWIITNWNDS